VQKLLYSGVLMPRSSSGFVTSDRVDTCDARVSFDRLVFVRIDRPVVEIVSVVRIGSSIMEVCEGTVGWFLKPSSAVRKGRSMIES
jgi:hypothetical protein